MPAAPPPQNIELRFSARNLINKDVFSLSDPFLVCHSVRDGQPDDLLGRTETVRDDLNPVWTTVLPIRYDAAQDADRVLVVDLFDRDSKDSTHLSKHDFLGRAFFRVAALLDARSRRLDLPLRRASAAPVLTRDSPSSSSAATDTAESDDDEPPSARARLISRLSAGSGSSHTSPPSSSLSSSSAGARIATRPSAAALELKRATSSSRAQKVRGSLTVVAEPLAEQSGATVVFRVQSALLRDVCALGSSFGRRITQFFEIQRERREGAYSSWSCVYRSEDGLHIDTQNYAQFADVAVEERALTNMRNERRLRMAFFKRHTRSQHQLISYVGFSLLELRRPIFRGREVPLRMEGEFGDDEGLGNVMTRIVDPSQDVSQSCAELPNGDIQVHLRADHFLHKHFVSSLNDAPTGHGRRLRQLPSFITLH